MPRQGRVGHSYSSSQALPFTRLKLQSGSRLLFLPPTLGPSSSCYVVLVLGLSGERTSESQGPHQERMLSGRPFLSCSYSCPPLHKHKAHAVQPFLCSSPNGERILDWPPRQSFVRLFIHSFIHSVIVFEEPMMHLAGHR